MKKIVLFFAAIVLCGLTIKAQLNRNIDFTNRDLIRRLMNNHYTRNNNPLVLKSAEFQKLDSAVHSDRSKTYYTYDSERRNVQNIYSVWQNQHWENRVKDEYYYELNGNLSSMIEYTWNAYLSQWLNETKIELTYSNNLLMAMQISYWTNNQWIIAEKIEYSYDTNKNNTSLISYEWNATTTQWENSLKNEYEYDTLNRLISKTEWDWNDSNWSNTSNDHKVTYAYDTSGNMILFTEYLWGYYTGSWSPSFKSEFTYDINNRPLLEIHSELSYDVWMNSRKIDFTYSYTVSPNNLILPYFFEGLYDLDFIMYAEGTIYNWNMTTNSWVVWYTINNYFSDFDLNAPLLKVSTNALNIGSAANSTNTLDISSNLSWTAAGKESWLTISNETGTGNKTITITAAANPMTKPRTATVTVSATGVPSQTVIVTQAGLPKTVNVTAGGLFTALTSDERITINKLIITETIDARDFKTMRDEMPVLAELDISGATIVAYSGTEGTKSGNFNYPANEVPDYAFQSGNINGNGSLTSVLLPSSLTSIGESAFYLCSGLTSINFPSPSSLTSIGDWAFYSCTGLTSITIPTTVTSIEGGVFEGCTELMSIIIPPLVTSIGPGAFLGCNSLNSLTIPSSVTSIEARAFGNCNSLASIYAHGVKPVDFWSSPDVFYNVNTTTCTLYVPYGSSGLYAVADQWKDFTNIVEIPVAGSIAASQSICSGLIPAPLTSTIAGAGPGTISYRWEYSYDGTTWLSTGTSGEIYAPGALVQTTMFRRITISTLNGTSWESAPTEPVTITVTPGSTVTPTVSISASQNNVCAGTPVTFTATPVNGGTTPAYKWFLNNVAKATGATGSYTPKNGDVIYVEMTSGLACVTGNPVTSNAITMVVNEAVSGSVSINVSQNNVCAGTPVTFTATPVNGGTTPAYKWFLNNVAKATGATGTYVPKNGDVVYVEMTSNHACSTGNPVTSNAITMVVNQPPAESVSINISQNHVGAGTPVTFTAIPVGVGTTPSFLWYLNNVARATGVSGTYAPRNGDEVYVVMTSASPCASGIPVTSRVVTMIVDGIPAQPLWFTQGKSDVYQGQSDIRYTVPNVEGVTYHWSYDGTGAIITGTSNSVLISFSCTATSGTLSVRASNSYGISEPQSGVITVGTTVKAGVLTGSAGQVIVDVPAEKAQLKVYPNPASGPVTFDFRITEKAKVILELFSSSGMRISRIYEGDVEADVIQTVLFNESLAPGVYIYMLKFKDQIITGKLIRKR